MSVIVRDQTGNLYLITKGAPEVLFERARYGWKQTDEYEHIVNVHQEYSREGLRVLAVGIKTLDPEDY